MSPVQILWEKRKKCWSDMKKLDGMRQEKGWEPKRGASRVVKRSIKCCWNGKADATWRIPWLFQISGRKANSISWKQTSCHEFPFCGRVTSHANVSALEVRPKPTKWPADSWKPQGECEFDLLNISSGDYVPGLAPPLRRGLGERARARSGERFRARDGLTERAGLLLLGVVCNGKQWMKHTSAQWPTTTPRVRQISKM